MEESRNRLTPRSVDACEVTEKAPAASHTEGPWRWDSDAIKGDPLGRVRYRIVAMGKTVTQLYYSSDDANAEADARLISAAPDLLHLWDTFPIYRQGESSGGYAGRLTAWAFNIRDDASAALRKAREATPVGEANSPTLSKAGA